SLCACSVVLATPSKECAALLPKAQSIIDEIKPDHRLEIFDLSVFCDKDQLIFTGESSSSLLISNLKEEVDKAFSNAQVKISYTPDLNDFNGVTWGLITVPVASLNTAPKFTASLSTQAVMGTPIRLLKRSNPWVLIQTPDGYLGWIHMDQFKPLTAKELGTWNASQLLITQELATPLSSESNRPQGVLPAGSLIKALHYDAGKWLVELPSGGKAFLPAANVEFLSTWLKNEEKILLTNPAKFKDNLLKTASSLIGTSYLWGGTSSFGVDCSGLISTIYRANGLIVPRDSDMQAALPEEVLDRRDLEKGDLVFFGKKDNEAVHISHVGIYEGKSCFIHSLGSVRKSCLDPNSTNYDAYESSRFLFGLRLPRAITIPNCIEWISENPFYSVTPHEIEPCRQNLDLKAKSDS
ncbi:MAG: C40 family peptidase, partial [Burkholderiales bacterium]|nr:C40 family peptidase [Burkholderiales bacterium]